MLGPTRTMGLLDRDDRLGRSDGEGLARRVVCHAMLGANDRMPGMGTPAAMRATKAVQAGRSLQSFPHRLATVAAGWGTCTALTIWNSGSQSR